MIKNFYNLVILFVTVNLIGCASQFTEERIDSLRIGMSSSEIKVMFGSPGKVSSSVCGSATPKGSWVCETWTYDSLTGTSKFTFSVKPDGKFLNDWTVEK